LFGKTIEEIEKQPFNLFAILKAFFCPFMKYFCEFFTKQILFYFSFQRDYFSEDFFESNNAIFDKVVIFNIPSELLL
jgi:hypothetical protein